MLLDIIVAFLPLANFFEKLRFYSKMGKTYGSMQFQSHDFPFNFRIDVKANCYAYAVTQMPSCSLYTQIVSMYS